MDVRHTELSKLDVSKNLNLQFLNYWGTQVKTMDFSHHAYLTTLHTDRPNLVKGTGRECVVRTEEQFLEHNAEIKQKRAEREAEEAAKKAVVEE